MNDALPAPLSRLLALRLDDLAPQLERAPALPREALKRMLLASDFAFGVLRDHPEAVIALAGTEPIVPMLDPLTPAAWPAQLRRWRALGSLRLVWRDVAGLDTVEDTLAGTSVLADGIMGAALAAIEIQVAGNHGEIRDADGGAQRMVVFGLGKLGGGELNFSSDVDLVFAYAAGGTSDGARPLEADAYYARIGQRLIQLLGDVTADGFCYRVDMRLRPFGTTGRLALSFAAMEQYYQSEGRDWERYAWIKARPVTGDIAGGARLLDTLRPFVYRRYLDYTALDGLREMKALIAADERLGRTDGGMAEHLKLGPGGIREIEFLVQALQLIRGGREPLLRTASLLAALQALASAGHLAEDTAVQLAHAYRFLRRLENRVQMVADQQVHALPDDPLMRQRIALGLGYADVAALRIDLDAQRALVSQEFERLLAPRRHGGAGPTSLADYWLALPDGGDVQTLLAAGFVKADAQDTALRDFALSPAVRALSERARGRLDRVLPRLLRAAADSGAADLALPRLIALLQAIARRGSYLALLDEQPVALQRLVDVAARSALLAERVAAHPLLLDELLDARAAGAAPTRENLGTECARMLDAVEPDDVEAALHALAEFRQGASFRIGLALLNRRVGALDAARQLAWLAETVLNAALVLARQAVGRSDAAEDGFAVIGYGSIGGEELGFMSDLDLVFLHACPSDHEDARRHARLAQKLVSLLGTMTPAGRLYDVDVRLRPDGAKGLLVVSVDGFADYQRDRAWTWERQALVRARGVAGCSATLARFEQVRAEVLVRLRDRTALRTDVLAMRARMRGELDRTRGDHFDLKQGEGGLVDLEFLLQYLVLAHAHETPGLAVPRTSSGLLATLAARRVFSDGQRETLVHAYDVLLQRSLDCTLDRRPRVVTMDAVVDSARTAIRESCNAQGLAFGVAASATA